MKCNVCKNDYMNQSLGGSGICPSCDCGFPPNIPLPINQVKCAQCGSTTIDHTEINCQINRQIKQKANP